MYMMQALAYCLSHELSLSPDKAADIVEWLEDEGVLDYQIIKETYEPSAANDR